MILLFTSAIWPMGRLLRKSLRRTKCTVIMSMVLFAIIVKFMAPCQGFKN